MTSPSRNRDSQVSAGVTSSHPDNTPSYTLQVYLEAEPTETERLSGAAGADGVGQNSTGHHEGKAREAIEEFDRKFGGTSD
ncbi:hypothetical protein Hte_002321 [Hypoxylon texense]